MTLVEKGVLGNPTQSINLFVSGLSFIKGQSGLGLTIRGSTGGYKYEFKTLPLFINGSPVPSRLWLFIKGNDVFKPNTSSINLFVGGTGIKTYNHVPLVIWGSIVNYSLSLNNLTLDQLIKLTLDELYFLPLDSSDLFTGYYVSNTLDLYISGEGEFDDFLVYRTWMNLYLQGGTGSSRSLNLFMKGLPYSARGLDLYSYGVLGSIHNSITLYAFSQDNLIKRLNLFIRGYK